MRKDEFNSKIAEMKWRSVSTLQKAAVPLVYGLGGKFEVSEIDLLPERGVVIVYGHYEGRGSLIRFVEGLGGDNPSAWIEIFLTKLPDEVPEAFSEEVEKLKTEFDIEPVSRNEGIALGTTLSHATDVDEIKCIYKHLQEQGQRLLQHLEGEAPRPFVKKAAPDGPVARVNGVIIN